MSSEPDHVARQERLLALHPEAAIVVRGAGRGGVNPNFVYLTGIREPRATLVLAPSGMRIQTGAKHPGPDYVRGRTVRRALFLPASDPLAARWGEEGRHTTERTTAEMARVDAVLPASELDLVLGRTLACAQRVGYVRAAEPTLGGEDDADTLFVERIRRRFFGLPLSDATPAVHEMRRLKDEYEVRAIVRAAALTGQALEALLARLRPGVREHELEAEITRVYRAAGAVHAFEPIVAGGSNAAILHYTVNEAVVESGRLLLIDTGAQLDGYCSDVTRTYPVDGRFSGRQRKVYETVLRAQEEAISLCRPGALLAEIHARAFEVIDRAGFGAQFVHGTGHHLGLEVHDPGDVHRPLAEGAVVTIEPGIYLAEEQIGVRIEDDVLVTSGAPRVLTEAIPKSVEAVERGSS
jgi:Xaa-Pro aminopeptidase